MYNLTVVRMYKLENIVIKTIAYIEQVCISILSTIKFTRYLKHDNDMFILLLEQLDGDWCFTHYAAYGDTVNIKMTSSEQMLDKLEKDFLRYLSNQYILKLVIVFC